MPIIDETNEAELKRDDVVVSNVTIVYRQEPDSCSSQDEYQRLVIETDDAGGGKFMILKTKKWAIDSIDDFINILIDYKRRSGMK